MTPAEGDAPAEAAAANESSVPRRGRSLLWTLSGLFLLTLAAGTLLQVFVANEVLRPLEERDARARAELVVSSLAGQIADAPAALAPAALDSLLAAKRNELGPRPGWILFRAPDGALLASAPTRARLFVGARADSAAPPRPAVAPPPVPGGPDTLRRRPRLDALAKHPVLRGGVLLGELQVVRPARSRGRDALAAPTVLLFLPFAAVVSLLAALLIVRLLVRRLRALESLAARVTAGDLAVRISDTSGDEIGRLAARLDRMAERLAEARTRVESTESQRRQLFADITHELATPLTSIRGYAETLLDPRVSVSAEERTRYVNGVLEESRRLDRLIRDLFDLARLEAGATPLERERLDWVALCRNTLERFRPRFADAGLDLMWDSAVSEAWIDADGHRMEEVLENLLANALRYVPAGGSVRLSILSAGGSGYRLLASDDGPGVATEELPRLFERFYRGTETRGPGSSRHGAGSGLGLAIVRQIVERHGGTVHAERRDPHGLTLIVELPANA